jgi:phytoene dehydrogenase-like protein
MSHFVVIGGGIAGLTAANALADAGSVTLLERSHSLGGRARTTNVDGYLLNFDPHALTANGIAAQTFRQWSIPISGGNPAERGEGKRAVVLVSSALDAARSVSQSKPVDTRSGANTWATR